MKIKKLNQNGDAVAVVFATVFIIGLLFLAIIGIIKFVDWNNKHNEARGRGDAAVGKVNDDSRTIYQMPDRFKNIALVCDEYGNAIYSTTANGGGASMYAVKDGCQ